MGRTVVLCLTFRIVSSHRLGGRRGRGHDDLGQRPQLVLRRLQPLARGGAGLLSGAISVPVPVALPLEDDLDGAVVGDVRVDVATVVLLREPFTYEVRKINYQRFPPN